MTLHRYGGSVMDWKGQTIIVDQNYLDVNGDTLIHLNTSYEMGKELIELYVNGKRLSYGEFTEVDERTIQLNTPLTIDDKVYIKIWESHYYNPGGSIPSPTDISNIQKTIDEIVNYGGANNLSMEYLYNDLGQITAEISTGDFNIERYFSYNNINEIETETINADGKVIVKNYFYDLNTYKLLRTTVSVSG